MIKQLLIRFSGFSLVGVITTLVSLGLIYILIGMFETPIYPSYAAIYILTIYLSYVINANYIFKVKKSIYQFIKYLVVYIFGMFVGMILINLYGRLFSFENWIITCLTLPFTTIWNFILVSVVLSRKNIFFTHKDNLNEKVINNSIILL